MGRQTCPKVVPHALGVLPGMPSPLAACCLWFQAATAVASPFLRWEQPLSCLTTKQPRVLIDELPSASGCQRVALLAEADTPGAATAGSNYQRKCWAWRREGALSGSPGNCCYPREEGRSPGGPAQPWACQPSPETGLGLRLPWQHPATNPRQRCPSQLLCDVYPWAITLPSVSHPSNNPPLVPFSFQKHRCKHPQPLHLPPSTKIHLQDGPQPVAVQPAPHPSLPPQGAEVPSRATPRSPGCS